MVKVINEIKPKTVKQDNEENPSLAEDFFNIIICLTSITRRIVTPASMLNEEKIKEINNHKEEIIKAIEMIADILNLDKEESYTESKKKLKEELKKAEYVEYDVIPFLRFQEIQANLKTVIDGYFEVGENITYEQTRNITTDLTRIENALDNIAMTISNELQKNLIYKEG